MERQYYLPHSTIEFHFRQSPRDFVVDEIPLYPFSGEGEHLVLHVRKKNLSTWQMIDIFSNHLGIKGRDIGYAGLKDKNAQTKQYISLPRKFEAVLENFEHEGIKILEKTYHNNKIRIGHLKGNRFFIRLKKVNPTAAMKIQEALKMIKKQGMPNYFGFQRFGIDGENYKKGQAILAGSLKERNKKLAQFYVNAYQSYLFNDWLSRRVQISKLVEGFGIDELCTVLPLPKEELLSMKAQKHPFKLIHGDVMMHYPHGKLFHYESDEEIERFNKRDISVSGLLSGKRATRATSFAESIEKEYDTIHEGIDGARRYGWIFPEEIEGEYKENEAWFELHFTLPKGCYATVLIEEIAKRQIQTDETQE
ncbi:MAG: tRNA pseudouridine(13) synthase TruD [Sulfuricurvum sp. GWF2_44_89]|uniref:tRNA pseudouridine synthase D n=1 Tax=Sulfuricurvum kujiense TaxID=148813 RepID=A0A2D3WMG5_9BACT|nr:MULTISPECIES: tRNA pseudouridine(13) synthase TruD [Sulfuricurvum]OHD79499.1 MAG: tRNA pseudouridine(13) synthase TruD [Sulfuricurvum sp. GWF2_44_89]OHD94389.1 MAG: tRNA pseudouridine(13) synthase TruD [Sulfuricurvum sp. RIFOXYD12_FULL_44_77]OHD95108.1 MAG: tRNA pseudouridine(13) synthase TruD [Sulfuricurvum sp. RIFOXYD2_FULL_44_160]DAB37743.1 MAG TPA: tRNA pseudouridine(13) synthase TruD [Sulfuricurvum kujiense]